MKNRLMGLIVSRGDTLKELAKALDITPQTLSRRINKSNGDSFTLAELQLIKGRYNLTNDEFYSIFFSSSV